jgi:mediator of replication checkpoint protein 1
LWFVFWTKWRFLGANEATRAFADTYKQTLQDDDQEFSYLVNQSESNDVLGGRNILTECEEEQDEDDEQEEETISREELVRQVRKRKEEAVCHLFLTTFTLS